MKQCATCKKFKIEKEFSKNTSKKDGLAHSCRECHKLYTRRHYQENKSYYLKKASKRNNRQTHLVREFLNKLKDQPCTDCGMKFPSCVMDFDHVSGKKSFDIARSKTFSLQTIKEEITKCELVCSNCHRIRTWNRLHPHKLIV